jgi:GTP cyclohydrolase II
MTQSGLADEGLASWLGDAGRLSVQRAIGELRAGRPVKLQGRDGESHIVAAAETMGGERLAEWHSKFNAIPALLLPGPRLRHLGFVATTSSHLSLAGLSAADIDAMLFAVSPTLPTIPQRAANALESIALELVKLAYMLPAAVILPDVTSQLSSLVAVDAKSVENFHDHSAKDLSIAARALVPLAEADQAEFVVFRGGDGLRDQIAVIVGQPDPSHPVLTRLHSACLTGDLFASLKCDCGDQLRMAIAEIAEAGGGVLLYLDQEGRGIGFVNKMRAYGLQQLGHDTLEADAVLGYGPDERRYAVASSMLSLLGFQKVILMTNNPEKLKALESFGISVTGHRRLLGSVNPHNFSYLTTKAKNAGHMLGEISRQKLRPL